MGGPGSGRRKKKPKDPTAVVVGTRPGTVDQILVGSLAPDDEVAAIIATVPDLLAQNFLREFRKYGKLNKAAESVGCSAHMHYYWLGDPARRGPRAKSSEPLENYAETFRFLELDLLAKAEDAVTAGIDSGVVETMRDEAGNVIWTRHKSHDYKLLELRMRALNRSKYGRDAPVQNNTLNIVFVDERDKM